MTKKTQCAAPLSFVEFILQVQSPEKGILAKCDAFKWSQHQPTGVPTSCACPRLLRPERVSPRWMGLCVVGRRGGQSVVWRAGGGNREELTRLR